MTDTVARLMELADSFAYTESPTAQNDYRQALEAELTRMFTESQLREALTQQAEEMKQLQEQNTALDAKLAQQEVAMRHVLDVLGPQSPECCGCKAEWDEAILALRAALEDIQTDCSLAQDGVCERLECPSCCAEAIAYYDPVEECVIADPMFESTKVKDRLIPLVLQYPTDTRLTRSQNTLTVNAEPTTGY